MCIVLFAVVVDKTNGECENYDCAINLNSPDRIVTLRSNISETTDAETIYYASATIPTRW